MKYIYFNISFPWIKKKYFSSLKKKDFILASIYLNQGSDIEINIFTRT